MSAPGRSLLGRAWELIGPNAAVTVTLRQIASLILSQAGFRFGIGINLASLRRFWAVAARRNFTAERRSVLAVEADPA